MDKTNWDTIKSDIKAVGMKTFIDYYYDFEKLPTRDLIRLFEQKESWGYNSMNTKASIGKTIFREQTQKPTLELIISSHSDQNTIEKASEIFLKEYPNAEIKKIRFIRPEFEFGQIILLKLFDGYKIIPQFEMDGYKIDWYIPELKLAIEFDEKHHSKNLNTDLVRQSNIEKKLNCKFLRYKYK